MNKTCENKNMDCKITTKDCVFKYLNTEVNNPKYVVWSGEFVCREHDISHKKQEDGVLLAKS